MKVLNFGSLNIDYVYAVDHFVQPGETLSAKSLQVNCGGKGLNQSIALAHAGIDTWHAGAIGTEGEFLKRKLDTEGVHTEFVRTVGESTGHAIIQVAPSGENCILLHSGANHCLTEETIDAVLACFSAGDVLLLQNETNCIESLIRKGAVLGMRVALNAAPAQKSLRELPLELLSWLIVNETEGEILSGETEPQAILRALRTRCPNTAIVLTLGADGSMASRGDETVFMPAMPVKAVDTTAAGDTFTGFFLRSVLENPSLSDALKLATAASAIAVTCNGAAETIPRYEEVLKQRLG